MPPFGRLSGTTPFYIAEQGGWKDAGFVFRVYQKAAKRRERLSGDYLAAFDRALEWARMGTNDEIEAPVPAESNGHSDRVFGLVEP
jgi:hypothetical protein